MTSNDIFLAIMMIAIILFALNAHRILPPEWYDILRNWGRF